jgi:peptidoglycan/xylan/chitin deacetylase (PgdA/CDA1 family)
MVAGYAHRVPERVFRLIFHGVGDPPRELERGEENVWISLASLRSVLDEAVKRPDVRLSFDDGNRSDHDLVLPELVARGLRATFFVVAGRIDQPGFLTRAALRDLVDAGMDVQSHGMHHRAWRGLDDASRHEELVVARELIAEMTGRPVNEVAIPFCLYDRRILRQLRTAGYRHVHTCDGGPADPTKWLQPRTQVSCGEDGRRVAQITAPKPGARAVRAVKTTIKRWR